jgi:hypothetical protein
MTEKNEKKEKNKDMKRNNRLFWQLGFLLVVLGCLLSACGSVPTSNTTSASAGNTTGNTWSASGQAATSFVTSNLYVVNTQVAYATDQNTGDLFQTQNAGKTWQNVAANTGLYSDYHARGARTSGDRCSDTQRCAEYRIKHSAGLAGWQK